jgi:hypothetical protein
MEALVPDGGMFEVEEVEWLNFSWRLHEGGLEWMICVEA